MSKDVTALRSESAVLDGASKFFRVMEREGVEWTHYQRSVSSKVARRNLAEFLKLGCPKVNGEGAIDATPTAQDLARLILGPAFITPEEVATARGLVYSDEQLEAFETTFPNIEQIAWCKGNGYLLLPNPPRAMSLLEVRDLDRQLFRAPEGGWYTDHPFARNDKTAIGGWLAVRKGFYPNSLKRNWKDQQKLVVSPEFVPNAGEMTWALTTFATVRGVRLLPNVHARTSSVDSDGDRVNVGDFTAMGLGVSSFWGDDSYDDLGVSSARHLSSEACKA